MLIALVCCLGLFVVDCSKKSDNPLANLGPAHYPTESAPSISLDRLWLVFAAVDNVVPQNSGLYWAELNLPIKRQLLTEPNMSSPTIAPGNNRIAYLVNGHINYYLIAEDSSYTSNIDSLFQTIEYIDDSVLIASAANTIYAIDETIDSVDPVVTGMNPTVIAPDSILYTRQITLTVTAIELLHIPARSISMLALHQDSIDVRGLSISPNRQWLVFTALDQGNRYVYSADLSTSPPTERKLVRCYADNSLVIRDNVVIFTGQDGRFFQTDYFGSKPVAYGVAKY